MATKRFSRLSIMLEARDSMSGPLKQAANAAQTLQGRVSSMTSSLNRSKNDIVNATVSSRMLADSYRQLAERLGATSEKVNVFTRAFRALPDSMRQAIYTLEGWGNAIKSMVTQNILVQSSIKVLSTTFNGLRAAISNITWDIQRGGQAFKQWFTGLAPIQSLTVGMNMLGQSVYRTVRDFFLLNETGQYLRLVGRSAMQAAQQVRTMGQYILYSARNSFAFQAMSTVLRDIGDRIKLNTIGMRTWLSDLPTIVRGTDAYKSMAISLEMVKQKIVAARLAFTLWSNSSRSVENIANGIEKVGNVARKILTPFTSLYNIVVRNIQGLRNFGQAEEQATSRGRAAFNQLVDANARLNRQLEQMNSRLERSNSLFGRMKDGISGIANLQKLQIGANIATNIIDRVKEPIQSMLDNAAQQQFGKANFGIIVGNQKKGDQYYKDVQQFAATTQYAPTEWAQQLTSVMKKVKNSDQLNKYMYTMEQLATMMPQQGLEGAAFAMRELSGGQITSLANRFDINKAYLKPLKKVTDPMKQAEMLSDMLGKQYGYSVANVQKMKQSPLMQFQAIKNHASNAMGQMGQGMMNQIAPELAQFNKAFSAGKFSGDLKKVSTALGNAAKAAIDFGRRMITAINSNAFKSKVKPIIDTIKQIGDGLKKSWPNIKATLGDVGSIISKFFAQFSGGKTSNISSIIQNIFKAIKTLADFINNHFKTIETTVSVFFGAMMAWKAMMFIKPMIMGIRAALLMLRDGIMLVSIAEAIMDALDPFTWIALAVGALVAAGIALYMNWGTVKTAMEKIFNGIARTAAAMVNGIISGINAMIGVINKIPGVGIPLIAKVSWGSSTPAGGRSIVGTKSVLPTKGVQGSGGKTYAPGALGNAFKGLPSHRTGLNRVPYDGYVAQLHKDERVLTHGQANQYDNGQGTGVTVTGNTFIVRQDSDIDSIADALYRKLHAAKTAMG